MKYFKTSEFTKLPTGITQKGWARNAHQGHWLFCFCLPHPRHSDFLIKHHLLNAKVQRTDLWPVSPELPYCKNAHLCRLKPLSLRQHLRVAPENQPAATCHHTGGAMTGQECRRNELFYRWWRSSYRCLASLMLLCVLLLARVTKAARLPAFVLTWLVLSGSLYREPSWTTRNSPLISSPRENLYIAFIASLPSPNLYDLCALKLKKNLFCESRTLEIIFWKSNKKRNWLSTPHVPCTVLMCEFTEPRLAVRRFFRVTSHLIVCLWVSVTSPIYKTGLSSVFY